MIKSASFLDIGQQILFMFTRSLFTLKDK